MVKKMSSSLRVVCTGTGSFDKRITLYALCVAYVSASDTMCIYRNVRYSYLRASA